jgi:NAD(P)-dependent dehydrogenase (short-subunit alcohol dehydrogenase family)
MSTHPALVPGNLAVITGAGYGGIGYSIAALLASKPYDMSVLIADNSEASLIQSQNKLIALGIAKDKIKIKQTDVTKYSEMEELVKAAYEFGKGKVDVLVLNAGIQTPTADFGNGKEEVRAFN